MSTPASPAQSAARPASPPTPSVDLHLGSLSLEGLPPGSHAAVLDGVRSELIRLCADPAVLRRLRSAAQLPLLHLPPQPAGRRAHDIGVQLARALLESVSATEPGHD